MRVLDVGMYTENGLEGLEFSRTAKLKDTPPKSQTQKVQTLGLLYPQGDYDMAVIVEPPIIEAASGLLKAAIKSAAWADMIMFPEFDLNAGLKAINALNAYRGMKGTTQQKWYAWAFKF